MSKLLIQGLRDEGPGDIVGAVAGETDVNPDKLGEIEIEDGRAFVEVDSGAVKQLSRQLDGAKIGGTEVSAAIMDDEDLEEVEEISDYTEEYKALIEKEREEEMRRHEESIRNLSGREREEKGKAILHLKGKDQREGLGGHKVKFVRQKKDEELPETEITVGDLVMVSKNDPLRDDNPTGTVKEKTRYSITAVFEERPQGFVYGSGLRMDLYVNDITYQRMKDALDQVRNGETDEDIRKILAGLEEPEKPDRQEVNSWHNEKLSDSQRKAVEKALGADNFHLIHGPPGTGKTTTAIEVIQQLIDQDRDVIATAASNIAVDNMLDFLLEKGVDAVRVGHPARVTPKLRENTLDSLVQQKEKYRESEKAREEAFDLKDQQEEMTRPSGRYRRGMSDEKIKELAEQGRGSRGVPEEKIQEMADFLELQEEIDELFEKSDRLEEEAVEEVLEEPDVVLATNSTSGSELLEDREFDVAVVDEATQATESSCLIPISSAEKAVMAGDHKQLPPTVKNQEASEKLEHSLFERIADAHPEVKDMLKVQYRMHEDIMSFSDQEFYSGELEAADSVKNHKLEGLDFSSDHRALRPDEPVTFIDTAGIDAEERTRPGSTSKENQREADIAEEVAEAALEGGLEPQDIGVISPYDDQVDLLDQKLDEEGLEVKTVDGFQGREKEVIVISLVRSNERDEIGFLKDVRRLNVALTRAKRKLVVIGDSETITSYDTYQVFLDYVDENAERVEK